MNTNFQTIHQMGTAISNFVKQATGRDNVQNIDMDHVTVAQNHVYDEVDVSGRVVQFSAGEAGLTLEKCVVQIEPVQDLHGYDHPWPAGGGKNKLNPNISAWVLTSGSYCFYGNVVPADTIAVMSFTDKNTSIDVSDISIGFVYEDTTTGGLATNFRWTMQDGNVRIDKTNTSQVSGSSVICPNVFVYPRSEDALSRLFQRWDIQVEIGTTITPFAPYSNICPITGRTMVNVYQAGQSLEDVRTFRFTFPSEAGVVYGGTLDVVTGELVVTHKMFEDSGSGWTKNANGSFYKWIAGIGGIVLTNSHDGLSNYGQYIYSNTGAGIYANGNNGTLNIGSYANMFETVEELQTAFSSVPLQVLAPLAEPQTYQLTPVEITTLLGQNNIWADTGDIEVKFTNLKELY